MPNNKLQHIAIIMDGNGRWAKNNKLPKIMGHKKGRDILREIITYCGEIKLTTLTVFAFSSENNKRPNTEVQDLFKLFLLALKNETANLKNNNVRLQIIGDLNIFNKKTQLAAIKSQQELKNCTGLTLVIALNYGGKWDIVEACKKTAQQVIAKKINVDDITTDTLQDNLSLNNMPDVDLLIRTSGEKRLSNFLLWQIAYSELFFTNTLWPDFSKEELKTIIQEYKSRGRRFGK